MKALFFGKTRKSTFVISSQSNRRFEDAEFESKYRSAVIAGGW